MPVPRLPDHEQPRERLDRLGSSSLSSVELLSILLGTGTRERGVAELATTILQDIPLHKLETCSPRQLCRFAGVSMAKASVIIASFELARRAQSCQISKEKIRTAKDAVAIVRAELSREMREHFLGLYLDARNGLLCKHTIAIGSLNASLVHPREIFKVALLESAAAVILVHNHPSGDPTPSDEDIAITRNLVKAGELLGIEVLDHIIVTQQDYFSFAESKPEGKKEDAQEA